MILRRSITLVSLAVLVLSMGLPSSLHFRTSYAQTINNQSGATNPAWQFYNQVYGRNVSGQYKSGIITVKYVGTFSASTENLSVQFPQETPVEMQVTRISNQSYLVTRLSDSARFVENEYLPKQSSAKIAFPSVLAATGTLNWLYGVTDSDNIQELTGASVDYSYGGGTYCCDYSSINLWLGITTDQGLFIQVTVTWGVSNCGTRATNLPVFSVGWAQGQNYQSISQCPFTGYKIIKGDQYVLQAAYDLFGTKYWYVSVYDQTIQTYAIPPTDITNVSSTPGTYVPGGQMGAVLEGICTSQSCMPDGSNIPGNGMSFTNPTVWSNCNPTSACTYNWNIWTHYSSTSPSPPNNVNVVVSNSSNAITEMDWVCSSGSCSTTEGGSIIQASPSSTSSTSVSGSGNSMITTISGYFLNPTADSDPSNNYFLFNVNVSALQSSGWSLDTSGLGDRGGPSVSVAIQPNCANCNIVLQSGTYYPSGTVTTNGASRISASIAITEGGTAEISDSWIIPTSSSTQLVSGSSQTISWNSAINTGFATTFAGQYTYDFQVVLQVPVGEFAGLTANSVGRFFQTCLFCTKTDQVIGSNLNIYGVEQVTTDLSNYLQGAEIFYSGSGFTPNGAIFTCLTTAGQGSTLACISGPNANNNGIVQGSMLIGTNVNLGNESFYIVDSATGISSNPVSLFVYTGVTGSLDLSPAESAAPPANFGISGCDFSFTSISGNVFNYAAQPNCQLTLILSSYGNAHYVLAGGFSSVAFSTCSSGSCGQLDLTYYYQLQESAYYVVSDGSSTPSNPLFSGTQYGSPSSLTLTTTPSSVWLDYGTTWTISPATLSGSNSTDRWIASSVSTLSGTVTAAGSISSEFMHQYYVSFISSPSSGGTITPITGWLNAGSSDSITATSKSGYSFSSWSSAAGLSVANPTAPSTSLLVNGAGTVTAKFVQATKVTLTLGSTSVRVTPRGSVKTTATIKGTPQSITLSSGTLPAGITISFAKNPVTDSSTGVKDAITITASSSAKAGTYHITITARGASGVQSPVGLTVQVT